MNESIRQELLQHVINTINEQALTDFEELHYHAFNEDYYIIGYFQAGEWLKEHNVGEFEAMGAVIEWEQETFGEVNIKAEDCNSEKIVNLYVYLLGEELLAEFNLDQTLDELLSDLTKELNQ